MTSTIEALGDPGSWSLVPPERHRPLGARPTFIHATPPTLVLEHATARMIHVLHSGQEWDVMDADSIASGTSRARLRRSSEDTSLDAFVQDLDRAFGPIARARLDLALQRLCAYCTLNGLTHEIHLSRDASKGQFYVRHSLNTLLGNTYAEVPAHICLELDACRCVMHPSRDGTELRYQSGILLDMPTTAHGRLELLDQARRDGVIPGV